MSPTRTSMRHFVSSRVITKVIAARWQHVCLILSALLALSAGPSHAGEVDDIAKLAGNDKPAAMLKLDQFLAKNPKNFEGRLLRGIMLSQLGKVEEAISLFTQLNKENPKSPIPLNNLAVIYAGQKAYSKALSTLEAVKTLDPNYPIVHLNFGDIYIEMAAEAYKKALEVKPDFKPVQAKLGMLNKIIRNELETPTTATAQTNTPSIPKTQEAVASELAKPAATGAEKKPVAVAADAKTSAQVIPAQKALEKTVEAWVTAWSKQRVGEYLAFYADSFKTPNGESLADWQKIRQSRITKPTYIRVMPIDLAYSVYSDSAVVTFKQIYEADGKEVIDNKKLAFVRQGDAWKIVQEEVVKP